MAPSAIPMQNSKQHGKRRPSVRWSDCSSLILYNKKKNSRIVAGVAHDDGGSRNLVPTTTTCGVGRPRCRPSWVEEHNLQLANNICVYLISTWVISPAWKLFVRSVKWYRCSSIEVLCSSIEAPSISDDKLYFNSGMSQSQLQWPQMQHTRSCYDWVITQKNKNKLILDIVLCCVWHNTVSFCVSVFFSLGFVE